MKVAIIDYDAGNLDSVKRAVEECGGSPFVAKDPSLLQEASHIILPGVGAFNKGMGTLKSRGFIEALKEQVLEQQIPFLGICLGMQLLADEGREGGITQGLGFIKGKVIRFEPKASERIPHIGWNEVVFKQGCPLFQGIESGKDFYFVHSYHFVLSNARDIAAATAYCGNFVSAVWRENIFGTQFHPEKSQVVGFKLLKNFLKLC